MPTYVYECPSCEERQEVVRRITEEEVKPRCKNCCEGDDPDNDDGLEMNRVITPTTFVLKGGCWAKDGYKK